MVMKEILQYSWDGKKVEKEVFLGVSYEGDLEGIEDYIESRYGFENFEKCNRGYLGTWYKVDVPNLPYNRMLFEIEEDLSENVQ